VRLLNSVSRPGPECVVLLEEWRAAYVEVPKVACSSIKIALADLLAIDLEPAAGNPHKVEFPAPAPIDRGLPLPDLFVFAFVRNPWDRLVSCYRDKIRGEVADFTEFDSERGVAHCLARFDLFYRNMPFEAFVHAVAQIADVDADAHFRSQSTFVTNAGGKVAVDYVGRYETLAQDFRTVCEYVGLPTLVLPRVQAASSRVRHADFYTTQTRDIVAERFAEDVELFGYSFERP
jgi:hypothetical protein